MACGVCPQCQLPRHTQASVQLGATQESCGQGAQLVHAALRPQFRCMWMYVAHRISYLGCGLWGDALLS